MTAASLAASYQEASTSSFGSGFAAAFPLGHTIHVVVATGREQVLAWTEALERLTEETGQDGAALGLRYLLEEKFAARKIPHLVCFLGGDGVLVGAVLLFEYRMGGFGGRFRTGLVATGDSFGVRTVFGASSLRGGDCDRCGPDTARAWGADGPRIV